MDGILDLTENGLGGIGLNGLLNCTGRLKGHEGVLFGRCSGLGSCIGLNDGFSTCAV